MGKKGQILSHASIFDGVNDTLFKNFSEIQQIVVLINNGSLFEASAPCEDTSDGVGGGSFPLLMFSVMSGDGAVCGFGLINFLGVDQFTGHHAE